MGTCHPLWAGEIETYLESGILQFPPSALVSLVLFMLSAPSLPMPSALALLGTVCRRQWWSLTSTAIVTSQPDLTLVLRFLHTLITPGSFSSLTGKTIFPDTLPAPLLCPHGQALPAPGCLRERAELWDHSYTLWSSFTPRDLPSNAAFQLEGMPFPHQPSTVPAIGLATDYLRWLSPGLPVPYATLITGFFSYLLPHNKLPQHLAP